MEKIAAKDALGTLSGVAQQEKISEAIDHIADSNWGTTNEGQAVVDELRDRQENDKIVVATQDEFANQENNAKEGNRTSGSTAGIADDVVITIDNPLVIDGGTTLESVLVHEGTHAVQRSSGKITQTSEERELEAFDNQGQYLQEIPVEAIESKIDLTVRRNSLNGEQENQINEDYKS